MEEGRDRFFRLYGEKHSYFFMNSVIARQATLGISRLLFIFSTLFRHLHVFFKSREIFTFRDFFGGKFCQHIEHQLLIGHIIAQIFLFQSFELFIFLGGHITPCLINNVSEGSKLHSLLQSVPFPFVCKVFANLYRFESLVNPTIRITQPFVVH